MQKESAGVKLAKDKMFVYDADGRNDWTRTTYNQKSKKDTAWDKHALPREYPQEANRIPPSSANRIGWGAPIDDMNNLGFGRQAATYKMKMDDGHLDRRLNLR